MIYLVMIVPLQEQEGPTLAQLHKDSDGWVLLKPGAWIVSSELSSTDLRASIGRTAAAVLVLRLTGDWASKSFEDAAQWLKSAIGRF